MRAFRSHGASFGGRNERFQAQQPVLKESPRKPVSARSSGSWNLFGDSSALAPSCLRSKTRSQLQQSSSEARSPSPQPAQNGANAGRKPAPHASPELGSRMFSITERSRAAIAVADVRAASAAAAMATSVKRLSGSSTTSRGLSSSGFVTSRSLFETASSTHASPEIPGQRRLRNASNSYVERTWQSSVAQAALESSTAAKSCHSEHQKEQCGRRSTSPKVAVRVSTLEDNACSSLMTPTKPNGLANSERCIPQDAHRRVSNGQALPAKSTVCASKEPVRQESLSNSFRLRQQQQPRQQQRQQLQTYLQRRRFQMQQDEEAENSNIDLDTDTKSKDCELIVKSLFGEVKQSCEQEPKTIDALSSVGSLPSKADRFPASRVQENSEKPRAPVLLGHPLSRKQAPVVDLEPKRQVDFDTSVPESVFQSMLRLGEQARSRGQHVWHRPRPNGHKKLVRHDFLALKLPDKFLTTQASSQSSRPQTYGRTKLSLFT
eukprot:TRINITY_DN51143_c0_g1_i1.p1 TRINITY_DN51143_c0_g1~~TRINITY_DN51143_c0_g1_i1.p1  ORF type:complete len:491 (-),score=47.94 TRINITY_DN51143_c0_g1_i1:439-1911(-)